MANQGITVHAGEVRVEFRIDVIPDRPMSRAWTSQMQKRVDDLGDEWVRAMLPVMAEDVRERLRVIRAKEVSDG